MHDGRFETLEEVLDFYSSGIQNHENLSPLLKQGDEPVRMNFSEADKEACIFQWHHERPQSASRGSQWS